MANGIKIPPFKPRYSPTRRRILFGRKEFWQYEVIQSVLHRYCRRYRKTLTGEQVYEILRFMMDRYGFYYARYSPPVNLHGAFYAINYPIPPGAPQYQRITEKCI